MNFKIILPTVACCIRLQQIIIEKSSNAAAILPEIVPVINVGIEGDSIYEIPTKHIEPISRLEQRIILCKIIMDSEKNIAISEALDLSIYVMRLFDELTESALGISDLNSKNLSFDKEDIIHELANHWKERIEFLEKIHVKWQEILSQKNRIDFGNYKNQMLIREIMAAEDKKYPIIMAGIFPKGPLLEKLGDVLKDSDESYLILPAINANNEDYAYYKTHYAYQAKAASERYKLKPTIPSISKKIQLLELDNIRDESATIIKQIEGFLTKNPESKLAIICRNKELISIIGNNLNQIGISHINMAGYNLSTTKPYEYFISLAESLEEEGQINIEKFISLLKTKFLFSKESRDFEYNLRKNHEISESQILSEVKKLKPILKSHIEVAEKLVPDIWQSIEGRILSDFLYELIAIEINIEFSLEEYVEFIKNISKGVKYHKNVTDQKVFFTNLEDADFCGYENIILADMNEDSIPGKVSLDPWMSPRMRENIGLTDLSEQIGIDWYHFKNLLQRENVIATRSRKKHGSITQKSRFLHVTK